MKNDSCLDETIDQKKIRIFMATLKKRGFIVQQGQLRHVDLLSLCSEGIIDSCLGNNVDALYAGCVLPPAPNQDPAPGQDPPIGYDPENPNNYPANIVFIYPGFTFKLRPDEAIVLIGQTPPPAYYFSFRSYLGFVQNKPGKDYSEVFTTGDDYTGVYHRLAASLGDQINNFRIRTADTPAGAAGDPFNSATIVINTADQTVNQQRLICSSAPRQNPHLRQCPAIMEFFHCGGTLSIQKQLITAHRLFCYRTLSSNSRMAASLFFRISLRQSCWRIVFLLRLENIFTGVFHHETEITVLVRIA